MAEPFGIVAGAVSIAATFNACVECFEYVQLGRHFGRDFQTNQIKLDCCKLRLTRWGESVDIHNDPELGYLEPKPTELQTAKKTLFQILALFEDTAKISNQYKLKAKAGDDISVFSTNDMDPSLRGLNNMMRELAIKRQKNSNLLKITTWALYRSSDFKQLIENITILIGQLETLFPASSAQRTVLVTQEMAVIKNAQELQLLEDAAQNVDKLLHAAVKEARTGHRYLNVAAAGQSKVQNGDVIDSNWQGSAIGSSNLYDGVRAEGNAKVLNGNKYGGKDFWED